MNSGGELNFMETLVAKKIGETWADGKCKTCTCELEQGIPTSKCTAKECFSIFDHPDFNDFVLEKVMLDSQCCPNFERVACKHAGHIYQVSNKWQENRTFALLVWFEPL